MVWKREFIFQRGRWDPNSNDMLMSASDTGMRFATLSGIEVGQNAVIGRGITRADRHKLWAIFSEQGCSSFCSSLGKGQDITMSATYRMIHGLDEPAKPKTVPAHSEGTNSSLGAVMGGACRPPPQSLSSRGSSLSSAHEDEDSSPNGMSCFSYSPEHPLSPFSPPPRGHPARQGLSFQILQILYDSDEEKQNGQPATNGHVRVQTDRLNSTADENDANSSCSSDGGGSWIGHSSMSLHHPGM